MNGNVSVDVRIMVSSDMGNIQIGRQIAMELGIHRVSNAFVNYVLKFEAFVAALIVKIKY